MMILMLLALQGTPTVGDTVWVSRTVALPAGWSARAPAWDPGGVVELLGRAVVEVLGDSVRVRYPLVVWQPGSHVVEVPGPVLLSPRGEVDSVRLSRVTITVASVLPAVPPDSVLQPQPPTGIIPRPVTSIVPLLILWGVAALLMLPLHWWWRRRGTPAPPGDRPEPTASGPPVARWAAAGEFRAVAAAGMLTLKETVARRVPDANPTLGTDAWLAVLRARKPAWPLDELGQVLHEIDGSRFAPLTKGDALELYQRTRALCSRIEAA
jgi:hypothetical protein